MEYKKVSDSMVEQYHIILQSDINGVGRLFGGRLIQWIDEVACIVAKRHSGMNVTTAAIDNLIFKEAAYVGQTIVITGKITYVGHSSMEIRVDSYVENNKCQRCPINRAFITMVALGKDDIPAETAKINFETESQKAEFEGAKKRIIYRKQRKNEGF